jgi:hypothetical protein
MSLAADDARRPPEGPRARRGRPARVGVTFVQPQRGGRRTSRCSRTSGSRSAEHERAAAHRLHVISGPFNPTGPGDTPSRARIFTCQPSTTAGEPACAREILSTIARRAFRGPVTDADLRPIMALYEQGRAEGSFEQGIEHGAAADPDEPEVPVPRRDAGGVGSARRDRSRARLAAVVLLVEQRSRTKNCWTMAEQGRLSDPAVLEAQVRRMLGDPRSARLVENFAGQWLLLRNLRGHVPNPGDFPNFDNELRRGIADRDGAVLREHPARGPQRARSAERPTTRSSTSGWPGTTASRTSPAATSAACTSRARSGAACWGTGAS